MKELNILIIYISPRITYIKSSEEYYNTLIFQEDIQFFKKFILNENHYYLITSIFNDMIIIEGFFCLIIKK